MPIRVGFPWLANPVPGTGLPLPLLSGHRPTHRSVVRGPVVRVPACLCVSRGIQDVCQEAAPAPVASVSRCNSARQVAGGIGTAPSPGTAPTGLHAGEVAERCIRPIRGSPPRRQVSGDRPPLCWPVALRGVAGGAVAPRSLARRACLADSAVCAGATRHRLAQARRLAALQAEPARGIGCRVTTPASCVVAWWVTAEGAGVAHTSTAWHALIGFLLPSRHRAGCMQCPYFLSLPSGTGRRGGCVPM